MTENNADYTKEQGAERIASIGETTYVVACCEMGESGTKHIHIFVVYKNAISLLSIKKQFPRAHLEPCKGSNVANRAYIVKDGDIFESGTLPLANESDRKEDISHVVIELLYKGVPLLDILRDYCELNAYVVANYRQLKDIAEDVRRQLIRDARR